MHDSTDTDSQTRAMSIQLFFIPHGPGLFSFSDSKLILKLRIP